MDQNGKIGTSIDETDTGETVQRLARELHAVIFPEEYDHMFDSHSEARERRKSKSPTDAAHLENPMPTEHIIGSPKRGELYMYLPGRNKVTSLTGKKRGFSTLPQQARKELLRLHPDWIRIPWKSAYQSYLALQNSVIEALLKAAPKIYDLEKCLFSKAEKLAILAAPELEKTEVVY